MTVAGLDIGGTKCASILADTDGVSITFISRKEIPTKGGYADILAALCGLLRGQIADIGKTAEDVSSCGISCGGPLDSLRGLILSPPNLVGWDRVPVCDIVGDLLGIPCGLQNDADACALAEWKFGAARGYSNIVFLTFGTGLGAGLILNGRLYTGACNMAGELGHIRIGEWGGVGYGKAGSLEGFASGGGIAQTAASMLLEAYQGGKKGLFVPPERIGTVSAKDVVDAAKRGDALALEILRRTGEMFGRGMAAVVDLLNPELIVAGGVFMRAHEFILPAALAVMRRECLEASFEAVRIIPAGLGERIGDYAAVVAGMR